MTWQNGFLNFKHAAADESLAVNELRHRAFAKFEAEGLPTKSEEAWRFTSLSPFKAIEWSPAETIAEEALSHDQMLAISKLLPSEFTNYVFVNGRLNRTLSDDTDSLIHVSAPQDSDFRFEPTLTERRLLNLSQAFLAKTINITLAKGRELVKPVQILFVQTSEKSLFSSEKLNVRMGESSEMKLILHSTNISCSVPQALNLNISVEAEFNSRLQLIQLQAEEANSFHFSQNEQTLGAGALVMNLTLGLGARLTRNFLQMAFVEENARGDVFGVSILDGDQHADNYTFIQHRRGANESVQHYKSILSGASHSVFRGRVLIEPNAQKANSAQLNNNLILTRTAQVDTVPQLEIFADDVKAGHGATVGQLNKEEIFYFLSRGINQYQAVKMLSQGFATELILKIENQVLREYLLACLSSKLDKLVENGK